MKLGYASLKLLRRVLARILPNHYRDIPIDDDPTAVSAKISELLQRNAPCMIARLGATELETVINGEAVLSGKRDFWGYLTGKSSPWWWEQFCINQLKDWSGVFPATEEMAERFTRLMLRDIAEIDLLGSWLPKERQLHELDGKPRFTVLYLDPFWTERPWTAALRGKRVLVVHPFANLIRRQYERRASLFQHPDVLPDFELIVLPAVQSLGGCAKYADWFAALEAMKNKIDRIDFDIALLGCGAYGLPLAAYIRRMGRKAIHMGGSLQLLFGIKGARWENPNFGIRELGAPGRYASLFNENWVYPDAEGRPDNFESIEGACYWEGK